MNDFGDIELVPDASRTIEGLRDTGYDFLTAIADIVDNSVAADASLVAINLGQTVHGQVEVSVADDGVGMSGDDLIDAMRYGARARPSKASLGKFGLGLKTASTSIARQLTVISRPRGDDTIATAQWDLDYVAASGRWLLRRPPLTEDDVALLEATAHGGGVQLSFGARLTA